MRVYSVDASPGMQILDNIDESMVSPSGGFGPVADDGYGVSYMIASDDQVGESLYACSSRVVWAVRSMLVPLFVMLLFPSTDILPRLVQEVVQGYGEYSHSTPIEKITNRKDHTRLDCSARLQCLPLCSKWVFPL